MIYFSVFLFFFSVFMLICGILYIFYKDKISIENRIGQVIEANAVNHEEISNKSFSERTVKPFYNAVSQVILKATPRHKIEALTKKLEKAGMLKNTTAEKWLYTKVVIIAITSVITGFLIFLVDHSILKVIILVAILILFINVILNFSLSSKIEKRKKLILKDLPYTLDLITVSVEAGLSFDGAMARVVNNIKGELCDEFAKSLKEIRMGIQRKAALKNMGERCEVKELSMLITSLVQADELGVSLGKVLRIESANLREHRKQIAREKAMKAPIKMLFPLIFFIFPSIFIIILGPAVIKMIGIFSK